MRRNSLTTDGRDPTLRPIDDDGKTHQEAMGKTLKSLVQTTALHTCLLALGSHAAYGQPVSLVKDINTALTSSSSSPLEFTEVNGIVFFAATDSLHGSELWRTDGTAAGTFRVKDIAPGTCGPPRVS